MTVLKRYPNFGNISLNEETVISLSGLTIYPEQRKIYHDRQEIHLTAKEYDLLCSLVYNKGRVLTYEQIYQKVWGEEPLGRENNAVGCIYGICGSVVVKYFCNTLFEKITTYFVLQMVSSNCYMNAV